MNTPCRHFTLYVIALSLVLNAPLSPAQVSAPPAATPATAQVSGTTETVAPPQFVDNQIVLTAEQSIGGKIMKFPDGNIIGVTLDKSCAANFKSNSDACIDWKLTAPLPAGWWHGIVKSNLRPGYANRDFGIVLMSAQKPSVIVAPNFVNWANDTPQIFEFWIYSSTPVEGVRVQPTGDLWNWNYTWPVRQITLERKDPTALTVADAVTMDLAAQPDGTIPLPTALPPGIWSMSGVTKKAGSATIEVEGGRTIRTPFGIDYWKTSASRSVNFYTDMPLRKITFEASDLFKSVLLKHNISRSPTSIATEDKLIVTVDPAKMVTGQLEMIGSGLTGEVPAFPLLPEGKKTVVLTSWDDGKESDLRCAEILTKYGYRPTFMLNSNSPALKFLDKLEALNAEVGSHGYWHIALSTLPPKRALEICTGMRLLLENKLQHPVISFAFPNGYFPAQDADGDYVLRAVREAGYWSGRTHLTKEETVDSIADPLIMNSIGLYGSGNKELVRTWPLILAKEGGVFYLKGHSWQIGETDEQWKKFEDFVAQFARQPDAWYPSLGEFSLWLWARKNVQIAVENKNSNKVVVKLSRPWLHPYLAAKCPLTFNVPAGVQKVVWQGKEIPVANGRVEITWAN